MCWINKGRGKKGSFFLREETVPVSDRRYRALNDQTQEQFLPSGVDQTVTVQRVSVLDVRVQSNFASPFAHSG